MFWDIPDFKMHVQVGGAHEDYAAFGGHVQVGGGHDNYSTMPVSTGYDDNASYDWSLHPEHAKEAFSNSVPEKTWDTGHDVSHICAPKQKSYNIETSHSYSTHKLKSDTVEAQNDVSRFNAPYGVLAGGITLLVMGVGFAILGALSLVFLDIPTGITAIVTGTLASLGGIAMIICHIAINNLFVDEVKELI